MTVLHGTRTLDSVAVGDSLGDLGYDVTATTVVLGALATRDWRPMHHDRDFAQLRNGVQDIFLNTPNLQAWYERYLTDWTGPGGRIGSINFRMRDSIFPGDHMVFRGAVTATDIDDTGCGWATVEVGVTVDDRTCTTCTARIALPTGPDDNPWRRRGDDWNP